MVETETKTASEHETWQVMTPEGVFDADLQTLKQWIVEGAVHPTDKVRKGSLKWIDAGRAPMLRRVFNGEETPAPPDTDRKSRRLKYSHIPLSSMPSSR